MFGKEKQMNASVSVARVLLTQKLEIATLKKMLTRVLEQLAKFELLIASGNPVVSGQTRSTDAEFQLPLKTREDVIKLDVELKDNVELQTRLKAILSLLGGRNAMDIVRVVMRGLMTRELRMSYVAKKPTKGKNVFKVHSNLLSFVIGVIRHCFQREKLPDITDQKILINIGLLFTGSADEDGGVLERKKKTALKKAVLDKYMDAEINAGNEETNSNASADDD